MIISGDEGVMDDVCFVAVENVVLNDDRLWVLFSYEANMGLYNDKAS